MLATIRPQDAFLKPDPPLAELAVDRRLPARCELVCPALAPQGACIALRLGRTASRPPWRPVPTKIVGALSHGGFFLVASLRKSALGRQGKFTAAYGDAPKSTGKQLSDGGS